MGVNALFCFTVSIIGLILIVILLFKRGQPSTKWLALLLFILSSSCYLIYLFESRNMLAVPFFFRVGPLMLYFAAPALFFYIMYLMNEKRTLKWRDTLHLLPALIYFIDFLPLYMSSNEQKREILNSLFQNTRQAIMFREGWFMPNGLHYVLRHVISLGYIVYLVMLLRNIRRPDVRKLIRNLQMRQWLKLVLLHFFLYSIFGIITYFFAASQYSWLATVWVSIAIFAGLTMALLLRPDILYGTINLNGHTSKPKVNTVHDQFPAQVQSSLRGFMENRRYLNKNIKLKTVADELGIQPYILSAYINQVYHMRFNDLINWCRIQYIKDGLIKGQWNLLTLEAIAEEAGFSNRTTFLTAFKKFTGVTPTAFLHGDRPESPELITNIELPMKVTH